MATYEKSALITAKDAAGNTNLIYPITTIDHVEGMDEITSSIDELKNKSVVTSIGIDGQTGDVKSNIIIENGIMAVNPNDNNKGVGILSDDNLGLHIMMIDYNTGNGTLLISQPDTGRLSIMENSNLGYVYHTGSPQLFDTGVISAGDGAAYTATVECNSDYIVAGFSFIMIPHTTSTTTTPTLNVNSLGAKYIRQRLSTNTSLTANLPSESWLVANKPVVLTYNGTYWVAEVARPDANSLYGTVPVTSGGTGATDAATALTNLGAAPAYTYGTDDMTAGTSALETGKLYFVYE